MADRPKLPKSIVVLNIIMIVIILAICGLIVMLTIQSKELGWALPTADSSSAAETSDSAPASAEAAVTVEVQTAE